MMRSVIFSCFLLILAACSGSGQTIPTSDEDQGSFLTGRAQQGLSLSDFGNLMGSNTGGLPINALLWRASLDIVSSIPIDDIDTFGGTIITEWYSLRDSPNERIKITFFVLDLELRSDAIRVKVHVQRQENGVWVDGGTDSALGRKLEELVLTRAREIRAAGIAETNN
jgi:hypothetical protein